ncbi:MAG: cell envelope biogenesis protein OmpA [Desulfuromonas sp.]|nr:MAG: cell envelope biogenesis protein OmpA [Desulfuromonas sp.]
MKIDHLQQAAHLINQGRKVASAAVGEFMRSEFRYAEQRFVVYQLNEGNLFVMCGPKANSERIDIAVEQIREDLLRLLTAAALLGNATGTAASKPSSSPENRDKKMVEKSGRLMPALVAVAFVLIACLGFGFFYLLGGKSTQQTAASSVVAAAANNSTSQSAAPLSVAEKPAETILRLHGSNTIGAKLAPALVETFLQRELHATEVKAVAGEKADEQKLVAELVDGRRVAVEIHAHGSSTAFKDLDAGLCDIGMASRSVKDKEVTALARFGDMRGPANEHVLALDGIAVIVHPANGVNELNQDQIAALFSGEISDWSELPQSGLSGPVHVFARDHNSGTWDTFKTLVLNGKPLLETAQRLEDSRELTRSVAADPTAIGFIGLPYIKPAKAIAVAESGTQAVYPTTFTVATEDYPLARRLFLYLPENPQDFYSRDFVEFALGESGQDIAKEIGFVELTIHADKPVIASDTPDEYSQEIADASRLSLNFRFRTGSASLDNRGLRDIDRLVRFLGHYPERSPQIKLFGFADNIGDRAVNCKLSAERAGRVADLLRTRGITADVIKGFCEDMPVASNATSSGREKNRRVEIWLQDGRG